MKKHIWYLLPILLFVPLLFTACPNANVLEMPSITSTDTGRTDWGAPDEFTASVGLKGRVEFGWKGVKGAYKYRIYETESETSSEFTIIKEVPSEQTTWVMTDCEKGSDKWYVITACKRSGGETEKSIRVHGTSLARPVINIIEEGEPNTTSALVHWYMRNVSSYQDDCRYTLHVYKDEDGNEEYKTLKLKGDINVIQVNDLYPNRTYYYTIDAYNVNFPDEIESSGTPVNSKTAINSKPLAVRNLTASHGTEGKITLSFELPDTVDIVMKLDPAAASPKQGPAEPVGIFFDIYRSIAGEDTYTKVSGTGFKYADFKGQYTALNEALPPYGYEAEHIVTWQDPDTETPKLNRSKEYDYIVISYAEADMSKVYASGDVKQPSSGDVDSLDMKDARAKTTGWLCANPVFSLNKIENTPNADNTEFVSTAITFNVSHVTKDETFAYYVGAEKFDINDKDNSKGTTYTKAGIEGGLFSVQYTDLTADAGYYKYKLFVYKPDDTAPTDGTSFADAADAALSSSGESAKLLVCSTLTRPEIKDFSVVSGYADKIVIKWTPPDTGSDSYVVTCVEEGSSERITIYDDGNDGAQSTASCTGSKGDITHTVPSGYVATYTIEATANGLTDVKFEKGETLGTPVLSTAEHAYKSITMSWPPANQAVSYQLTYGGQDSGVLTAGTNADGEWQIDGGATYTAEGNFEYTFDNVEDYDDPAKAGNNIVVTIKAKSKQASDNETSSMANTYLLGPAAIKNATASAEALSEDRVTFSWDKLADVDKYFVFREQCTLGKTPALDEQRQHADSDGYFVTLDERGNVVTTTAGSVVDDDYVTVALKDGVFTLTDKTKQKGESSAIWNTNQDLLAWGYPFRYIVFPVMDSSHQYDANQNAIIDSKFNTKQVEYEATKLPDTLAKITNVKGFGLNVEATKSTKPTIVEVTFDAPPSNDVGTAKLWRRRAGTQTYENCIGETAQVITPTSGGATINKFIHKIIDDEKLTAYEYAVSFKATDAPYTTYINELAATIDTQAVCPDGFTKCAILRDGRYYEPQNKGYSYSMSLEATNVAEGEHEGFTERVRIVPWDFVERAVGPTGDYSIQLLNLNNAANRGGDWTTIATFNNNLTFKSKIDEAADWVLVSIASPSAGAIQITPSFVDGYNTHMGLLRVLRDYKHYYRISSPRTIDGEDPIDISVDNAWNLSESNIVNANAGHGVATYRKITPQELVRCVNLIYADAMYQTGMPENETNFYELSGGNGKFQIRMIYGKQNDAEIGTAGSNYQHNFTSGPNSLCNSTPIQSSFIIRSKTTSRNTIYQHTLKRICPVVIHVDHVTGLQSYKGAVWLSLELDNRDWKDRHFLSEYCFPSGSEYESAYQSSDGNALDKPNKSQGTVYCDTSNISKGDSDDWISKVGLQYFPYSVGKKYQNQKFTTYYEGISNDVLVYRNIWWWN